MFYELLLSLTQKRSFGMNSFFELETSNQCFFKLIFYQLRGHAIFFRVYCLSNKSLLY